MKKFTTTWILPLSFGVEALKTWGNIQLLLPLLASTWQSLPSQVVLLNDLKSQIPPNGLGSVNNFSWIRSIQPLYVSWRIFASKSCNTWRGLEHFGRTWINFTRSCQLYVAFPDGKEPFVYLLLIYTECRTRQRSAAWASSRRWELASHAPSSEVTWSRFFPTVELPHPSWIQCQSKLSLFFSGRFSYLAQRVDTSVVLECKMFFF